MQYPEGYAAYFGKILYIYYIFMSKRHLILISRSMEYSQCVTNGVVVVVVDNCHSVMEHSH